MREYSHRAIAYRMLIALMEIVQIDPTKGDYPHAVVKVANKAISRFYSDAKKGGLYGFETRKNT